MSQAESKLNSKLFTNFDGKFKARLSAVIPAKIMNTSENAPISARYDCRVKVEYHKEIMSLVEEGMILAVKNFKTKLDGSERYTLLVASRIWPEHYGLRAISEHTYYPMQFEVIDQSVGDWDTDDKSTMMIQISAIPVNYDLLVDGTKYDYVKGFSYPLIGSEVFLLNPEMIKEMYNRAVLEKMRWSIQKTSDEAKKDPKIGIIKMFENSPEKIPIYVNFDSLVRYHFGVFAFTGGGKSNILSNTLRKILLHTQDTKIVIFDISSEYPFLLMDIFADPKIKSNIILESPVKNADEFFISVVKPKEYEDDERVRKGLAKVFDRKIVNHYVRPALQIPRYSGIIDDLNKMISDNAGKQNYVEALEDIQQAVINYITEKQFSESKFIDEDFVDFLSAKATEAMEEYKVHEKAGIIGWASSRHKLKSRIQLLKEQKDGLTTEKIRDIIEGDTRLVCISISEPSTIKQLVGDLSREFLQKRKRQFKVRPYILFVFDEAQEFVQDVSSARGVSQDSSKAVETLLRQGRKFGLGGCIATQRIAHLNTNALQQLHTYFVGTLPRPYDRNLISSTFTIDQGILEKTLEFAPGEWLLSSYIATGMENVPIFIKSDNAEKEIESFLSSLGK